MDDGVRIDASLLVPDGPVPTGGWPAVDAVPRLGGNHKGLAAGLAPPYLKQGLRRFRSDARGHGTSGGYVSLDGPRESQTSRRVPVACGQARGERTAESERGDLARGWRGWNSVVAGVPFKALETFETWERSVSRALSAGSGKAGAIYSFAQSVPATHRAGATALVPQMIGNENLRACGPCSGHGRASAPCPP